MDLTVCIPKDGGESSVAKDAGQNRGVDWSAVCVYPSYCLKLTMSLLKRMGWCIARPVMEHALIKRTSMK